MVDPFASPPVHARAVPTSDALFVVGALSLTVGYATALILSFFPTGGLGCTHGGEYAFIPVAGPLLRMANYPSNTVGSDPTYECTSLRGVTTTIGITIAVLQIGGVGTIGTGAVMASGNHPSPPPAATLRIVPGAAGAPLGATLSVVTF